VAGDSGGGLDLERDEGAVVTFDDEVDLVAVPLPRCPGMIRAPDADQR
jgi:hypothetical protein